MTLPCRRFYEGGAAQRISPAGTGDEAPPNSRETKETKIVKLTEGEYPIAMALSQYGYPFIPSCILKVDWLCRDLIDHAGLGEDAAVNPFFLDHQHHGRGRRGLQAAGPGCAAVERHIKRFP